MLDGSTEDLRNTGVMVNADGDFVIAKPDKAAWELYQEKAKASAAAAAEAAAAEYSKELQARGLECPIDKRMFLEPTVTPCCHKTYCNDCITNALIESDFVCPGCGTEGVLLDNLTVDKDAIAKIKFYETEKAELKKEKEKQLVVSEDQPTTSISDSPGGSSSQPTHMPTEESQSNPKSSKKRPADDEAANDTAEMVAHPVSQKKQKPDDDQYTAKPPASQVGESTTGYQSGPFGQQMPFGGMPYIPNQGMPPLPFSDPSFMGEAMGFANPMGFPNHMDQAWTSMNPMNFNPVQNGLYGENLNSGAHNGYGTPNMYSANPSMNAFSMPQMQGQIQQNSMFQQGPGMGNFSNQQRTTFSTPFAREEDTAYFRQPVNPQRHQARNRRIRPSDYREL